MNEMRMNQRRHFPLIFVTSCPTMKSVIRPVAGLIRLRRTPQSRPILHPRSAIPLPLHRPITIQASPPSSTDNKLDPPSFEIVDDAPSTSASNFASSSQHPFSSIPPDPEASSSTLPARLPNSSGLPQPPETSEAKWTRVQHPFDTHAFVSYLEKAGLKSGTSTALMEATRMMIVKRSDKTRESMMAKEDMENVGHNSDCCDESKLIIGGISVSSSAVGTSDGVERKSQERRYESTYHGRCHPARGRYSRAEDEGGYSNTQA